ncbi:class I SAM-dependent methyltransferase [Demequina sp.]|uniref:class I SAM-dependent methyltransferase n=1 Tax=Demequina sp. TaxID=2050685 RepID=UPI003D0C6CB5
MASLGTSFGTAAADYERGRPGYLPDAVAWLLAGVTGVVADVGAGTGKLTAEIVAQGFQVTAIDPDEGMLAALADHLPQVPRAVGTAESLPLADGSCGAVTLGQAWHWVDVSRASAEIARVLVPGGVLGLIWNVRDESVPWVAALGAAMGASAAESLISSDDVDVAAPFGEVEERIWHWQKSMSRNDIRAMVRSRSYYIAGDEGFKRRVDGDVDTVLGTLADGPIQMPYATHAYRALRP